MPDNLTAPATGAVLATDEVGGAHYQRFKPAFGADGSATDVSTANPLPVTVGLTDAQLRASAVPVAVNFPAEQAVSIADPVEVTGQFFPATQPVSGNVGVTGSVAVTGPLTDAQLRATPVAVSGTFFQATQPVSIAAPVSVTGTFWQATQPISAASLPLPTGAATSARQDTNTAAINKLGSAKRWFPITPDGNTDLAPIPDAVYVGGAGDVVLKGSDGTNATFAATAGQVLPFSPTRVLATGTTATGLVGLVS